jgi:hypothetical protein
VASNDVWAVGYQGTGAASNTLIEPWNGMSWSVVSAPRGGGVTALSDGTVVVVSGGSSLEN